MFKVLPDINHVIIVCGKSDPETGEMIPTGKRGRKKPHRMLYRMMMTTKSCLRPTIISKKRIFH